MTLYEELKARGLVAQITDEEIIDLINNGKATFYIGFVVEVCQVSRVSFSFCSSRLSFCLIPVHHLQ